MATDISGLGGAITLPGNVHIAVTEWSARHEIEAIKIPAAFGERYASTALGQGTFNGSFRGKLQYNSTPTKPFTNAGTNFSDFSGSIVLTAIAGCTFTFNGHVSSVDITRPNSGEVVVTGDFSNSDQTITIVWDETP